MGHRPGRVVLGRVVLGVLAWLYGAGRPAGAATLPECAALMHLVDATAPAGPEFLPSYPGATMPALHDTAYLYDNALAVIALLGCGEPARAARIGNAIRIAAAHDRFWHDGRLRNAYREGAVANDQPPALPGWWDGAARRWDEDGYAVGSETGNMAWAALALLWLAPNGPHRAARRIMGWVARNLGAEDGPGFVGGFIGEEPLPQRLDFRATEQNASAAAAFRLLGMTEPAARAARFVAQAWQDGPGFYAIGMNSGTVAMRPVVLDAQLLPGLAGLGDGARNRRAGAYAKAHLADGHGFGFAQGAAGVWSEGTALAALALHDGAYLQDVRRDRAPDGLPYATDRPVLRTLLGVGPGAHGDDFRYYHLPSLAAGAFAALAATGTNPYQPKLAGR